MGTAVYAYETDNQTKELDTVLLDQYTEHLTPSEILYRIKSIYVLDPSDT
jgi:hypothetical protein